MSQAPAAFAVFIQEFAAGEAHQELSRALADIQKGVNERGGSAELTFKLKMKPYKKGDPMNRVTVTYDVTTKMPSPTRGDDIFFLNQETGRIQRNHPRQSDLDLRPATPTHVELKKDDTRNAS